MAKHHPENERVKHRYLDYLRAARGMSEATIDVVVKAIRRYEEVTSFRDFRRFHIEQAISFRSELVERTTAAHGGPLSRSTVLTTLNALRAFFLWLADQPGYRRRIRYADAEYFRLSEKETRIARSSKPRPVPTLEQLHHLLSSMPSRSDTERRDRAVVAFVLITGIRDGALITLKLKHLDLAEGRVIQDAREVGTKFSKSFVTWFYPVGGQARTIVEEYAQILKADLLWGQDDPLFPATEVVLSDASEFTRGGLKRTHWHDARHVREIFRSAGAAAGLQVLQPSFCAQHIGATGFPALQDAGGAEGMVTEHGSQRHADHVDELRRDTAVASGGVDTTPRECGHRRPRHRPCSRSCCLDRENSGLLRRGSSDSLLR